MSDDEFRLDGNPPTPPKPERREWPPWFNGDAKSSPATHRKRVWRGLHPLGQEIGPEDQTCGGCRHRISTTTRGYRVAFPKCAKSQQSDGKATDCLSKWRACVLFQPRA